MGSRLKLKPEEIYQFYAEIRWVPQTIENAINISITVLYPPDKEVDVETAKQLNKFCFPTGQPTFASSERFCFVLTDQDGLFRFGFCRYDTKRRCCMFLLSYLPWFDCFYGVLLMLQGYVYNAERDPLKSHLPTLLLQRLHNLSIPPPNLTSVSLSSLEEVTLQQAMNTSADPLSMLPSLPIPSPLSLPALSDCQNIQLLYSRLEPETIISLFASILNERRVIVYSNSLTNLTAVVHGSNQLLYPLFWQHIYIPILPSGLTDYCCAPMPFLCGVPSSLMERVRNLPIEDVVLLDIDSSQIETPFDDQLNIPKELIQPLMNTLKKPVSATDQTIPEAFLQFFALLLGGYRRGLQIVEEQNIAFDQEIFKESQPEYIQEFLESLFQLQMFDQFIASRTLSLKSFTDDPFEQKCRNLKDPLHKTTSQKLSVFGDKFIDAKDNLFTKIKDIEIIRSSDIKSSTNDFIKHANTNLKTLRCFLNKQVSKSSVHLKKAIHSDGSKHYTSTDSLESSISVGELNEIERQFKTLSRRISVVIHKKSPEVVRPTRAPPPIPPPYSKHRETRSNTIVPPQTDTVPINNKLSPANSKLSRSSENLPVVPPRIAYEPKQEENEVNLISFESLPIMNVPPQPPMPLPRKHLSPKPAPKPTNYKILSQNAVVQPEVLESDNLIDF